jgi:hypothetical protein
MVTSQKPILRGAVLQVVSLKGRSSHAVGAFDLKATFRKVGFHRKEKFSECAAGYRRVTKFLAAFGTMQKPTSHNASRARASPGRARRSGLGKNNLQKPLSILGRYYINGIRPPMLVGFQFE